MDNVGASYGVGQNNTGEDVCLYLPPFVIAANEDKQDLGHMVAQLLGKLLSKPHGTRNYLLGNPGGNLSKFLQVDSNVLEPNMIGGNTQC